MANDLKQWKTRLTLANRKFDSEAKTKIETYRKYFKGDQWGSGGSDSYRDKTVDNMVFSNIKTIMPSINLQNPKIFVGARKKPHRTADGIFDTLSAAAVFELGINYFWRELEIKRQTDKCLLDALLGPWGIIWMGYTAETEKVQGNEEIEDNELIKSESPFAVRISPMDFRSDSEGKDSHLEDATWVARRWVKSLNDVKKNPRYKNTGNLKANTSIKTDFNKHGNSKDMLTPSTGDRFSEEVKKDANFDMVEGWELWDKKHGRLITIVESHDKFLEDEKWPLEFDGFPCETLYFNEDPDELFPLADTEIYIKDQDELNRLNSCQLAHVRNISQRKYIGNESKFEDISSSENKLAHGGDGTIVWTNGDPTNAMTTLKDANISQDLYIAKRSLKDGIREKMGVAQFEQGVAQKFDTATEPGLMAQGITIRRSERIALLEDFLVHIARKLGKIMQQTLKPQEIPLNAQQFEFAQENAPNKLEKIVGEGNSQVILPWLNFSAEDIAGDYNFEIDVGSTAPINQEKRKQDVLTLTQILQGNPLIDDEESTRRVLEAFGEKDTDRLMRDPQEVAQESQQAQQQALQTEIAKDQPKRDNDLQKTQMKNDTAEKTTLMKVLGANKGESK